MNINVQFYKKNKKKLALVGTYFTIFKSKEQKYKIYMTVANRNTEKRSFRIENSTLFRECEAERQEILKHKWLESEKHGKDIGFEFALIDWVLNHRDKWRNSRSIVRR